MRDAEFGFVGEGTLTDRASAAMFVNTRAAFPRVR
jgi:hypothetical protein